MYDKNFMLLALKQAQLAYKRDEVPVGAVVVLNGEIVAEGHNCVESFQDASCHGEMVALRAAQKKIGSWRLVDATLYTTLEPCLMCAGAAILSRVKKIVYGAPDLRHGAPRSTYEDHPIHRVEVEGGVLQEECSALLKSFFKEKRNGKLLERDDRASEEEAPQVCRVDCPSCDK